MIVPPDTRGWRSPADILEMPKANDGRQPRRPGREPIRVLAWREIEIGSEPPALISGFLPRVGLCCIYGESGCGKSFLATDMSLHVALGSDWHGNKVEAAGVIYIAAEGSVGMRKRVVAFRRANGIDVDSGTPFALIPSSLDLRHDAHVLPLVEAIKREAAGWEVPVGLVVVDTLSRVMAGGDENSPLDMGKLVATLDLIRALTGACVCVIHHSGKDATRGARGHSSFRAALDAEIFVQRDPATKIATATVTKQRDGEEGQSFSFQLESRELEDGRDGPITSCVVVPAKAPSQLESKRLTRNEELALAALVKVINESGEVPPAGVYIPAGSLAVLERQWRDACFAGWLANEKPDTARKSFRRAKHSLLKYGHIGRSKGWVSLSGTKRDMAGHVQDSPGEG